MSRLTELVQNLGGTPSDLTLGFAHNPAGQIVSNTRSNDAFSFTGHANFNIADTVNGLNQVTATGSASVTHDARGNVTAIGSSSYGYSSENMMISAPGSTTLGYDPLLRLYETAGGETTRFGYDGVTINAEYNASNVLQRRYVHGPGVDEPLVWYEGTGTSDRRWLHADERGTVIAVSEGSGNLVGSRNRYDEYGVPQGGALTGRFGYTGQAWLPEFEVYYYRARAYNPVLGRFMQADPIGYAGGMNLYAYVGNNPVNLVDPSGLCRFTLWGRFEAPQGPDGKPSGPWELKSTFVTQDSTCDSPSLSATNSAILAGLAVNLGAPRCSPPPGFRRAAATPHGETRGDHPRPGGGGYNTDLPGFWLTAANVFVGLARLAHDPFEGGLFPDPRNAFIIARSPGGIVQLRAALDASSPIGFSPRIDIRANAFGPGSLTVPETIHFKGGDGPQCPTT